MSWKAGRTVGYNAAYAEIYAALDDLDHARRLWTAADPAR